MNKFNEAEITGRKIWQNKLNRNNITEVRFTQNPFNPIDVIWKKENQIYVGEIKYREKYSHTATTIVNEGLILEKTKYDEMNRLKIESGFTGYYISIMNDCYIYLYNVNELDNPIWVEKELPATTKGDNSKKTKLITYIPISDCWKCKYKKDLLN